MTSCVLSAFFFISLVSSVTAVDPTGLKLRITNRALDVLRHLGLEFLQALVNQPLEDFSIPWGITTTTITGLKLTHLAVDPAQTAVRFQENSGLQFEIQDLDFAGELARDIVVSLIKNVRISEKNVLFAGRGVNATIEVKLNRNPQGRLNVEILTCVVRADDIITEHSGITGWLWDSLKPLYRWFFNNKLCPAVQTSVVPKINNMLEELTMTEMLYELQNAHNEEIFNINYSLSGNVMVTSCCLDVPFKGVIFRQGETVDLTSIKSGMDPVFGESDLMAYVGISEFFFNSAAMSLYNAGPFQVNPPEMGIVKKLFVQALELSKGPIPVNLAEPPIIRISTNGVSTTMNAEAKSLAEPADKNPILPVVCQVNMKVNIQGNRLILLSQNSTQCEVKTETIKGKVAGLFVDMGSKISGYLESLFTNGIVILLPEGVDFTEGNINYHDGFMVIGGNLNFTPAGKQKMVERIGR